MIKKKKRERGNDQKEGTITNFPCKNLMESAFHADSHKLQTSLAPICPEEATDIRGSHLMAHLIALR